MSEIEMKACDMCNNARIDGELTDDNDLSFHSIGICYKGYRMMYCSGDGRPPRIEVENWDEQVQQWVKIGMYKPKFCPNCGREIKEYE